MQKKPEKNERIKILKKMKKICAVSGKEFEITEEEIQFRQNLSPKFNEKTLPIPEPETHPDERIRNLISHRNEQYLYHNISCFSGKTIISIYPKEFSGKICTREEWFSDIWDPIDFAQDFDESKTFFQNFKTLQEKIPRAATVTIGNENSDFTTGTGYCKNCYLINSSEYAENCLYSKLIQKGQEIVDSSFIYNSELLYECFNVKNGYESKFLQNCKNCSDSWFLKNCIGCSHCFGCVNLKNKEYYFLNQKCSPEDYLKKIKKLELHKFSNLKNMRENFVNFTQKHPFKYSEIINSEDCTGDFISSSKNCQNCYDLEGSQDCQNVYVGEGNKDVYDSANIYVKAEMCLQTFGTINIFNCNFCFYVFNSNDLWYCEQCFSCQNCFGCVGLRNKKYHIFNKPYTPEAYEKEVRKIIEQMQKNKEWGEFFPAQLSPFPYNKTLAQYYFPLTQENTANRNYHWESEEKKTQYNGPKVEIPDSIQDVSDEILKQILECEQCQKNYRLVKPELNFYRKMNLPIPHKCPNCRHSERMKLRNPRKLWNRTCDNEGCQTKFQTTFAPERPEKVYCEKCYLDCVN